MTLNAYELWQQQRNGVPTLGADRTERWYRVARPNMDALYGWGDEIDVDAWTWLLNDMADLTVNVYSATVVKDADVLADLAVPALNIADELEALVEAVS